MLKKRLLTIVIGLNTVIGFMPGALLGKPKKQEICFELAQEQYKNYLTESRTQSFVKKAECFCSSRQQEIRKQTGTDFVFLIWSAFFGGSKNAKTELGYLVNADQIGWHPSFKQDLLFLPEWVLSYIVLPSAAGSLLVGWMGVAPGGGLHRYNGGSQEFKEFRSTFEKDWNFLKQEEGALSQSWNVERGAQYNIKYRKMSETLTGHLGSDFNGGMTEDIKKKMLACIQDNQDRCVTNYAWWVSATKIAGVVFVGSLMIGVLEAKLQERKERIDKIAFDEFMKKPDSHVVLAQKLNEFCAAMPQKS